MIHKLKLILMLVVLGSISMKAQTKKAVLEAAEKAMMAKNYHAAVAYYDDLMKFDTTDAKVVFKTAEAGRLHKAYGYAAKRYDYLINTLKNEDYPEAHFRLGEMYHYLGRYNDAITSYNLYISEYTNTNMELTSEAKKKMASAKNALYLISQEPEEGTQVDMMTGGVHSDDADYAASDMGGNMYFSTLRFSPKNKSLKYKQVAKTMVKEPHGSPYIIPGKINDRDLSVAHFSFTEDGKTVYYSICDYQDGWSLTCSIYKSDVTTNGQFANEVKLNENINLEGSSNTQPAIGKDLESGADVLYFVSDRQGGEGGRDIYMSKLINGEFQPAINIKSINTDKDEISPFYYGAENTLYFSTDGREGYGGFDIFRLEKESNLPKLLPMPYNTSMNDMFYFLNPDGKTGYITSNRAGKNIQYDSYEACCMDIYSVQREPYIILDVLTLLKTNGSNLTGTRICLLDADKDKEIECLTNGPDENKQTFKIRPNKSYKIIGTKEGYTMASDVFIPSLKDKFITKKLYLEPDLRLDVFTFDKETMENLIGTTVTLTDLTDGSEQVVVLENETDNYFIFNIIPDRNYKLEAKKDGYFGETLTFDTNNSKGVIRKDLYLLEEKVIQDLLPISLYFDNDYPNPKSRSPLTNSQYRALVQDYYNQKSKYITNFTASLSEEAKLKSIEEYNQFFDDEVKQSDQKLKAIMNQLIQRMDQGEKIELEVRGFASPRSQSDYNKILSQRRVKSILNEIGAYDNGALNKYVSNGSLTLKDVSFGDKKSKPNVVGDLKDRRNSVYNLDAARERRVEIIKVNYK